MEQNLSLQGIVLSAMPVGEYDKRLSILTKERGKISAFARGARRPKSQLLAASNPFAFGTFEVYQGRDAYTLHRADIDTYFTEVTGDMDALWYGYYFLESAEYFGLENADEHLRMVLLYMALRALSKGRMQRRQIRLAFDFKTLVINGDYPNVFACGFCGSEEELSFYSAGHRACVCAKCKAKDRVTPVSPSALYTLQFIAAADVSKLFSFQLTEDVEREVSDIIRAYYRRYVKHEFNSEAFLESN
ncbi:MAG: DNA repair protein RecO [Lachnospiraceae bacterium]|nr:DNA repair protein RecO [Lachnospiraceae bacterium]